MKFCPKCNLSHSKPGTFCSRTCANSRTWTEADKLKKSISGKKYYAENDDNRMCGWHHSEEYKQLKRQKQLEYWDKKGRKVVDPLESAKLNVLHVQNYRAKKYKATPVGVNRKLVREIYKNCPAGYEVDHIIPLCEGGLHHPDNFQYLPALENRRKNRTQNYDKSLAIRWQDMLLL